MNIVGNFISNLFKGDSRSIAVKKNAIANILIKGISILVSLVLVPMTLGYLKEELYGIWLTLSSIMLMLTFLDVGFTLGLKNRLAEAIAQTDYERGKSLVSTTYVVMIAFFIPLYFLLIPLIRLVDWSSLLNVDPVYSDDIRNAMYILAFCFCMQMITNVLISVYCAFQKVAFSTLFPAIGQVLSLLAMWLLIMFCPPSLSVLSITISVLPILVVAVASVIAYRGEFAKVAPSFKYFKKGMISDLFGLGVKFFLIQVQMVVLYQSTNLLISNISNASDVVSYNIAYKYLGVPMMIFTLLIQPLWPAYTDAYVRRNFDWMRKCYKNMSYVFLAITGLVFLMVLFADFAYSLWVGDSTEVPFVMTAFVALYMIIHSWDTLQVNLINGVGKVKLQTYVTLFGLFVHIPLSYYIGENCGLGAVGVVISMCVINVFYCCFFTYQICLIINNKDRGIWAL